MRSIGGARARGLCPSHPSARAPPPGEDRLAIPRAVATCRMTQYQHVTGTETVLRDGTIKLHGPEGFEGMRKAGRLAAEILDEMADACSPASAPTSSTAWCAR